MKNLKIVWLLFVCLFLSSCNHSSHFELKKQEIMGDTFYLADQKQRNDEPVIFLCHGLGGDHTDMESASKSFFQQGYTVVSFDLYGHEGISYPSDIYIDDIIEESEKKISRILKILEDKNLCQTDQFGIYGYSVGGMIGFYMASYGEISPTLLITMASLPDFEVVFQNSLDHMATKYDAEKWRFVRTTEDENEMLQQWASEHNPIDQLGKLAQTSIIMVNGTEDPYMLITSVRKFKKELTEAGGMIQSFENPGGNHSDLGDYHFESILESAKSILPVAKE